MSQPDPRQQKFDMLQEKYNELFKRTAELTKLNKKTLKSKRDLETTIKFLRADLNSKSVFQGIKNTSNFEFIGGSHPPKGERLEPGDEQ